MTFSPVSSGVELAPSSARLSATRKSLRRAACLCAIGLALTAAVTGCSDRNKNPTGPNPTPQGPPLLIAFASTRPPALGLNEDIYFYDVAKGGPPFLPANLNTVFDESPQAFSGDGHTLAFFSARFLVGSVSTMFLYDVATAHITLPNVLNSVDSPNNPALSFDGHYLAFQYQVGGGFTVLVGLMDVAADTMFSTPNLNDLNAFNFDPYVNGDASLIALVTDGFRSTGAYDVVLYSVPGDSFLALPGVNSTDEELSPSLSADGRYLAYQSGRPGGEGMIDVYVYDRLTGQHMPLPGANTNLSDYQPTISPDGRYLSFATDAAGAGDVRLYDIQQQTLVPLPGLNDPYYMDEQPVVVQPIIALP